MKKYYIFSLFLVFSFLSFSQDYVYDLLTNSTGSGFNQVSDISVYETGDIYLVGTFRNEVTLENINLYLNYLNKNIKITVNPVLIFII